jgi:predicted phage tail component-like protein
MAVQPDSFTFGGVDMLSAYGVRVLAYDALFPARRARKQVIPTRDGAYDFGAGKFDERRVKLECASVRRLTRQELREAAFLLTQRKPLTLWDEPEKHYIGRVQDQTELKYIGRVGHEFTLTFICEPFAYGAQYDGPLPERIAYVGTATTPTLLTLTNTGATPITGLTIRIRSRRI